MNQTLTKPQPTIVPHPMILRVRSLLAVACIAILGLTIAVVLLATNQNDTSARPTSASGISRAQTADAGARLDHSGRRQAALLKGSAERRARLDPIGRKAFPGR
jgi:hypothetical protein